MRDRARVIVARYLCLSTAQPFMIEVRTRDRMPTESFELAWRFTDLRWNRLPPDALDEIFPLRSSKAAELHKHSLRFFSKPYELERGQFPNPLRVSAPAELGKQTKQWLQSLDIDSNQTIFVSWGSENAVVTEWRIFSTFWTDFCYPASDDVVVWPPSERWVLAYYHFEEFSFRQLPKHG